MKAAFAEETAATIETFLAEHQTPPPVRALLEHEITKLKALARNPALEQWYNALFDLFVMPVDPIRLDTKRMEGAADRVVSALDYDELTRAEALSVCMAVACNHAIATGVPLVRLILTVRAMYGWRAEAGTPSENLLVAARGPKR